MFGRKSHRNLVERAARVALRQVFYHDAHNRVRVSIVGADLRDKYHLSRHMLPDDSPRGYKGRVVITDEAFEGVIGRVVAVLCRSD